MPALTAAKAPTAYVSEVPGRFSPVYVVDKRLGSATVTSTTTNSVLAELPRTESINASFTTPTTEVSELGTNFHVGEYDDLPEVKVTLSCLDVSEKILSLITQKNAPTSATTVYGFNDLATTTVDVVRQFADPNGNVFASMYLGDLVVEDYSISLKSKAAAMESYSLAGFNMAMVKGYIQTKAYVALTADATANSIPVGTVFGPNEFPVALPVAGGGTPANYWQQRGSLNFFKVERLRAGQGYTRLPEVTSAPSLANGSCYFSGTGSAATIAVKTGSGDIVAGDVFFVTYWSYACDTVALQTIPQTTLDTSDPVAIPTRLTPFSVAGQNINRGVGVDIKMTLKRERAEGIGDTDGQWGPPDAPDVALTLDVKQTDFKFLSVMMTGSPNGTDSGGTVAGDFFDPNAMTRYQLNTAVPLVVKLYDPRNAGVVLKTITSPTAVFTAFDNQAATKSPISHKFTGKDRVGNIAISVTK